uniref:Uncharacterized protein n=1 Tax=Glossina austeni TaxID=7395 RepID=A0A1A9VJF7_GLOAU
MSISTTKKKCNPSKNEGANKRYVFIIILDQEMFWKSSLETHVYSMTIDSVIFLPSENPVVISISNDNEDDLEDLLSTQSSRHPPVFSTEIAKISRRSELNWATVSQSRSIENNQMWQFVQSGITDYHPRCWFQARCNEDINYDHYFNDGFDVLNLYQLTPMPYQLNDTLAAVKLLTEFLAVTRHQDRDFPTSTTNLEKCTESTAKSGRLEEDGNAFHDPTIQTW